MSDYDEKCIDLDIVHGELVKMECIHPWSDEVYANAVNPFNLSGWYRLTFEDGAKVEVTSIFAYALAQGSYWFTIDDSGAIENAVFVREPRSLAYLARMGASLIREKEGECEIPSTVAEAEQILWGESGLNVPYEPLRYGCREANENMKRWVEDWKKRGLIKWDEDNHEWQIVRKSLNGELECGADKRTIKTGQQLFSLDGKEVAIVDANMGKAKRISVQSGVEVLLLPRNPIAMEVALTVEYENGKEYPDFYPWETLALGWVRCHTEDGQPGLLCNKQVVAAIGRAIDNLEPFLDGNIAIPSEEEADEIITELDIPYPPISYGEAGKIRPFIKMDLMKKWKKSGKLCQMKDGSCEIEELPDSKNVAEVRMALEHREKDEGREARIAKSGKEVALEAAEAEKHESLFAIGATKKKKCKLNKTAKVCRWPKNKAEHRENQMRLWGGLENLAQYETREMKTSAGKTCAYYVKIDSNGRVRIADLGEDAPMGYYSQSARYYALKRNAQIAKRYSTTEQRIMWFACLPHMKMEGGFLDTLGNKGLIRKIGGKYVEMNFGMSASGRKLLDKNKTYSPGKDIVVGGARLKRSRYSVIIEQAKTRPGAWAACFQ